MDFACVPTVLLLATLAYALALSSRVYPLCAAEGHNGRGIAAGKLI